MGIAIVTERQLPEMLLILDIRKYITYIHIWNASSLHINKKF